MPKNCRHCGAENKIQATDCVKCSKNLAGSIRPEPKRPGQSDNNGLGCVIIVVLVIVIGALGATCSGGSDSAERDETPETVDVSAEEKLAVISGDSSDKLEFGRILDQFQTGTGICNPEPSRDHVADVITAGWEASGQSNSLLEFAQTLLAACG